MATDYPGAIDGSSKLPNPATTDKRNSPSHAGLHTNVQDAVKAVETKLGTGSSAPASNTLLFGNGSGSSAWTQLTSSQLAASLSDETGTGLAVFGTTPTLTTPKIDTINESTPGNGTTIGGVNIKSGALVTSNSVVTANITNGAVTANKLGLGGQAALVATLETTTSTSYVDLTTTSDTVTVTVGANGILQIPIYAHFFNSGANFCYVSFALSGANTQAANDNYAVLFSSTSTIALGATFTITGLSTGSTTVKLKYRVSAGTGSFLNRRVAALPL